MQRWRKRWLNLVPAWIRRIRNQNPQSRNLLSNRSKPRTFSKSASSRRLAFSAFGGANTFSYLEKSSGDKMLCKSLQCPNQIRVPASIFRFARIEWANSCPRWTRLFIFLFPQAFPPILLLLLFHAERRWTTSLRRGLAFTKRASNSWRNDHRRIHPQLTATIAPFSRWSTRQSIAMSTCSTVQVHLHETLHRDANISSPCHDQRSLLCQ